MINGLTDVGLLREINEDSCYFYEKDEKFVIAVSDGMGGHNAGEVASRIAVDAFKEFAENNNMYEKPEKMLRIAFREINDRIYAYACQNKEARGMGATVVAAVGCEDRVVIGNIGDSRAYIAGDDKITQITEDHSYVNELLKSGMITEEEARIHPRKNEILKAVGIGTEVFPDIFDIIMKKGERLLLCTDGLTNMVTDSEILEILNSEENNENAVKRLIDAANEKGGSDNITAVLKIKD